MGGLGPAGPLDSPHTVSHTGTMLQTFPYRLYPPQQQQRLRDPPRAECRWRSQHLLAERKTAWEARQAARRYGDQAREVPDRTAPRPAGVPVPSQPVPSQPVPSQPVPSQPVLQHVAGRRARALKACVRRGPQPGAAPGAPSGAWTRT
jgi:hypothetical protein